MEGSPQEGSDLLQDLLVQCLDAIAEGGLDAAAPIVAAHPDLADRLRERLHKLEAAGLLPLPTPKAESIPERLGDFRLLQRLGAGGMGVVYLAVQESLGREVALKLVRPEQLFFPGARERFRREVEAVARLNDPGIVGIHVVGEDAGIPYFAMERVVGATLAELLLRFVGRRPEELTGKDLWRALLDHVGSAATDPPPMPALFEGEWTSVVVRLVEQMARAVAHAHAHGVLHRDLKTSNAMLRLDGRVVLLDFGLAQARGTDRLTRTGAQVGTLHTMAPEQLRGDIELIDERTDVYALGVVLYELLTLRVAFPGDSYGVVQKRILDGNPLPPSRHNPAVSWEQETVCQSAMEPLPERRYPSASALQRDLTNLLEHRSIEARRPGAWLRLYRFAQRHRTLTATAAIALLALLVTPIVVAVRERGLNETLRRTIEDRDREMRRARANLESAAAALNRILQSTVDESVQDIHDLRDFNDKLLKETATCLDTLIESNPEEPSSRLTLAETLAQAAELRWGFLEFDKTTALFERSLALLAVEPAATRAVAPDRYDAVLLDVRLAYGLLRAGKLPADRYAAELHTAIDSAAAAGPIEQRPWNLRTRFADGLSRLGELDRTAAGLELQERAQRLRERIATEREDIPSWLHVAHGERDLANRFNTKADVPTKRQHQVAERNAALHAVACKPASEGERMELADYLTSINTSQGVVLPVDEALHLLRLAIEQYDHVRATRPSRKTAREGAAQARNSIANLMLRGNRLGDALEWFRAGGEILRGLTDTWPDYGSGWYRLLGSENVVVSILRRLAAAATDPAEAARYEADRQQLLAQLQRDSRDALQRAADLPVCAFTAAEGLGTCALELVATDPDSATAMVEEGLRIVAEANARARQQRTFLGTASNLRITEVALSLRRNDRARALTALRDISQYPPSDLYLRVPALRALRDDPDFGPLLQRVKD